MGRRRSAKKNRHRKHRTKGEVQAARTPAHRVPEWWLSVGSVLLGVPVIILFSFGVYLWSTTTAPGLTFLSLLSWGLGLVVAGVRLRMAKRGMRLMKRPYKIANDLTVRSMFARSFALQWLVLFSVATPVLFVYGWFHRLFSLLGLTPSAFLDGIAVASYWVVSVIVSGVLGNFVYDLLKRLYQSKGK